MQSKGLSIRNVLLVVVGTGLGAASFTACGVNYEFGGDIPDAYPCLTTTYDDYHSLRCVQWRCKTGRGIPEDKCPDAGTSDGGSSEDGGSSARCSGTCVKNAPLGFGAPQPVYIGPAKAKYVFGCPDDVGAFAAPNQYNDLHVPSPGCPTCVCGSIKGSCSPPDTITLRPGGCGSQPRIRSTSRDRVVGTVHAQTSTRCPQERSVHLVVALHVRSRSMQQRSPSLLKYANRSPCPSPKRRATNPGGQTS
jgi:hypothetical protein